MSIDRSEYSSLFDYLNSKEIKIKNPQEVGPAYAKMGDGLDLGGEEGGSGGDESEDDGDYEGGGDSSHSGDSDDSGGESGGEGDEGEKPVKEVREKETVSVLFGRDLVHCCKSCDRKSGKLHRSHAQKNPLVRRSWQRWRRRGAKRRGPRRTKMPPKVFVGIIRRILYYFILQERCHPTFCFPRKSDCG